MQIMINLPPDLEQDLTRQAARSNIPLQTLILNALRQTTENYSKPPSQWPEVILTYEGLPDFPALESYRDELLLPSEPELF